MKKKFRCLVCGYVYEGENPPAECPICHAKAEKFVEIKEEAGKPMWACEHELGVAKGCDPEVWAGLQDHFKGECSEVGMYLAMSRQAEREGYPEVADAFKRYAFEEADHAARIAELLGEVVWDTKTNLPRNGQGRSPPRCRLPGPLQPLLQEVSAVTSSDYRSSTRWNPSLPRSRFFVSPAIRAKRVSTG